MNSSGAALGANNPAAPLSIAHACMNIHLSWLAAASLVLAWLNNIYTKESSTHVICKAMPCSESTLIY
jgi:hypothetical protein